MHNAATINSIMFSLSFDWKRKTRISREDNEMNNKI
jgi:hypothetical protein